MRTRWVGVMVLAGLAAVAACGDDDGGAAEADDGGTGTVAVSLEPTDGFLVEGFEVGLRFSDADGTEINRVLWSDFVASQGDDSIEAFYDSVLEQEVPAGPVVVEAQVSIGIGPPPEPPNLDADELPCRLEVEVAAGERVEVQVAFLPEGDCLSVL
jgi:hypothetical protein